MNKKTVNKDRRKDRRRSREIKRVHNIIGATTREFFTGKGIRGDKAEEQGFDTMNYWKKKKTL